MFIGDLIRAIDVLVNIFSLLVIVHILLSYFLPPYHTGRVWIDRIVRPFLEPIRRYVPPVGMLDFSPMVLIILVQLIGILLRSILTSFL